MQRNPDFAISADLAEGFVWQKALRFDALAASRLPCALLFLLRSLPLHDVALSTSRCSCRESLLLPWAVALASAALAGAALVRAVPCICLCHWCPSKSRNQQQGPGAFSARHSCKGVDAPSRVRHALLTLLSLKGKRRLGDCRSGAECVGAHDLAMRTGKPGGKVGNARNRAHFERERYRAC